MVKQVATAITFESEELLLIRRNPVILALTLSPILGLLLLAAVGDPGVLVFAPIVAVLSASLTLFAHRENWRPLITPVVVRADGEGVMISGRFIPRARIRAGLVMPDVAPRLVLRCRLQLPVELQTESLAEARTCLRSLGLDASQTSVDFHGLSWVLTSPLYVVVTVLALPLAGFLCSKAGFNGRPVAPALLSLWILAFLLPTRLRVSTDGLALRWLWVRRFIGHGEIEDVTCYDESFGSRLDAVGLRIELSSKTVLVPMGLRDQWSLLRRDTSRATEVALAWERIREAALVFHGKQTSMETAATTRSLEETADNRDDDPLLKAADDPQRRCP